MESLADRDYCYVTLHSVCQTHLFTYSKKVLIKCIHTNTEPHLNTEFTFFDSMGKEPVFEIEPNSCCRICRNLLTNNDSDDSSEDFDSDGSSTDGEGNSNYYVQNKSTGEFCKHVIKK